MGRFASALDTTDSPQAERKVTVREVMTMLKPYFWPNGWVRRFQAMLSITLLAGSKVCNLFVPLALKYVVDDFVNTEGTVTWNYGWTIGYGCLRYLTTFLKEAHTLVYLRVKQDAYREVASSTFSHLHNMSMDFHLNRKTGEILRSMDRGIASADSIVSYLVFNLTPTIFELLVVCILFIAAYDEALIAAICFISILLYIALTFLATEWRKKFRKDMNQKDNQFHEKAVDSLVNFETVKYFANEDYELDRYSEAVRVFQKARVKTMASLNFLNSSQQFLINFTLTLALLRAGNNVLNGHFTVGDFVMTQAYILQLFQPLSWLGSLYGAIIQALIDMRHLLDLRDIDADIQDAPGATPLQPGVGAIAFKDVHFHYPSQESHTGLKGFSMNIPGGQTFAIVGHTGAGKSTLSRLLFRFYDPQDGSISIDGQNVAEVTQKSLRESLGIVPQDTVLFNDTIENNILYGRPDATEEEVIEAARTAAIHDFILTLPEGYKARVGERGLKLSGGEKQRVAIARMVLKEPAVIVLDEATSALDNRTEKEIQDALHNLTKKSTTIVIAHRLSTIVEADQIVVMGDGKILEQGTHKELLAAQSHYYAMWMKQSNATKPKGDNAGVEAAPENVSDIKVKV